jgi:hypothetical protein
MWALLPLLICAQVAPAGEAPPGDGRWHLIGELRLQPRGIFVVNVAYNSGTLASGSTGFYALPPLISRPQFFVSPQNTVLGFKLSGLSLGDAAISGALDVNLRSSSPLATTSTISPQFYDVHIQLDTGHFRVFVGQFPDVVLPFVPDALNSFPAGYVPGALGFARPQVRADVRWPADRDFQFEAQGSLSRPIQTFELGDELAGRQAGVPDLQGRLAIGLGPDEGALRPWGRPYEAGASGHVGRRRLTVIQDGTDVELATWSLAGDVCARLATGTLLKARVWWGSLMGDYAAGIFHTANPQTRRAIHARGLWAQLGQALTPRWRAAVLYGRDDPRDADLSPGQRRLNQAGFANLMWDLSKTVGLGIEVSRWSTDYVEAGRTRLWRGDLLFFLHF